MNAFFLDLLHDLREKRMAPIAGVLLVALVAVPLVVMKPAGGGPGAAEKAPTGAAAASGAGATIVQAVEEGPGSGNSSLGVFDPKDPFKAPIKRKKPGIENGVAKLVKPLTGSVGTTPSTGSGSGSVTTPSGGGGGSVAPKSPPGPTRIIRQESKLYQYVVDMKFGPTGDERTRRGVKRLSILPNSSKPLVVFLGVTADAKQAVFLVDSRASQSGEGECRPTVKNCNFLYLRPDPGHDEQFVSDDTGREYHMTLTGIRRVEVKKSSAKKAAKTSRRRVRVSASEGVKQRVVELPVFAPDVQR